MNLGLGCKPSVRIPSDLSYRQIMLNDTKPETYTQAYQAGVIYAQALNYFGRSELPTFTIVMVNYHALRELFGERKWQKLKALRQFTERIALYERLAYQPTYPKSYIGTSADFCLGFSKSYSFSKLQRQVTKVRSKDLAKLKEVLK